MNNPSTSKRFQYTSSSDVRWAGKIEAFSLCITTYSALPRFLLQNRRINSLELRRQRPALMNFGGLLTLDWSQLRRTGESPHHGLKRLSISIDLSKPCVDNIAFQLREILRSANQSPIFDLETFVLRVKPGTVGRRAITSLPPYSQVAALLVQLAGRSFELKIKMDAGASETTLLAGLRSQLVQEVRLQQDVASGDS